MKTFRFAAAVLLTIALGFISGPAVAIDSSTDPLPMSMRQVQEITPYEPPHPGKVWFGYSVTGTLGQIFGTPPMLWSGGTYCHDGAFTCLSSADMAHSIGYFTLCAETNTAPCIESLEGRASKDAAWVTAKVKAKVSWALTQQEKNDWSDSLMRDGWGTPSDIADNKGWQSQKGSAIFASADGPITFEIPGVANAAGNDNYLLDAGYEADYDLAQGVATRALPKQVHFNVRPFVPAGPGYSPRQALRNGGNTGSLGMTPEKAFEGSSASAWAAAFSPLSQFRVKVRMPNSVSGWFAGRLDAPDITVEPSGSGENLVTISGTPVDVPTTSAGFPFFSAEAEQIRKDLNMPWDQASIDMFKKIEASGGAGGTGFTWVPNEGLSNIYQYWTKYFPPVAKGQLSLWSVTTLDGSKTAGPCFQNPNRLQGMVTSNAMVYQAGLPTFTQGRLDYSVSGVHFNVNNEVFQGTYRLIMRSDIARCVYGFSSAPIEGTVSVTSAGGAEQVAYTNVNEKDGWLSLTAQGFTFSDPTISVKLTQAKGASTSPSSGVVAPRRITITCTKGKLIKKVIAASPKCPAGYKKKA